VIYSQRSDKTTVLLTETNELLLSQTATHID